MTLELDEREAAILGLVGDTRVDNSVDDAFHDSLHLVQNVLQRPSTTRRTANVGRMIDAYRPTLYRVFRK